MKLIVAIKSWFRQNSTSQIRRYSIDAVQQKATIGRRLPHYSRDRRLISQEALRAQRLPRVMAMNFAGGGFNNPFGALGIGSQSIASALGVGAIMAEKLPGYDTVQSQLQRFNIDLGTVTTWMLVATACWTAWNLVTRNVYMLLDSYYCCSIRITSEDGLFHDFFSWLQEERANDISSTRMCDAKKKHQYLDVEDEEVKQYNPSQLSQVVYNPTPGALYHFRHNGHTIQIIREQIHDVNQSIPSGPRMTSRETVQLKYYGREPGVLRAVLDEVICRSNSRDQGRTVLYQAFTEHGQRRWDRSTSRPNRSISTVILEEDQKKRVVEDIEEYLLPATTNWYANRGLPYRRGYLLYGPPGNYIYIINPIIHREKSNKCLQEPERLVSAWHWQATSTWKCTLSVSMPEA